MKKNNLLEFFLKDDHRTVNDYGLYTYNHKDIGMFFISQEAQNYLYLKDREKPYPNDYFIKLMSETAKDLKHNQRTAWISKGESTDHRLKANIRYVEDYNGYQILHSNKPNTILECLGLKRLQDPFEEVPITFSDVLFAECFSFDEINKWLKELERQNLITLFGSNLFIQPKGWFEIEKHKAQKTSNQVFIAMSFSIDGRLEIQNAIVEGCRLNGFEAKTVDQEQFNGKITDKIIAAIKESKFIVSEFSTQNHGVYFESGFAEGLGKTVIYCVRSKDVETLHFDTAQTNHIVWDTPDQLKEKLSDRIRATIL